MSTTKSTTKSTKVLVGAGVVVGIGAALYFLFKRQQQGLVPSLPSDWGLPSFATTHTLLTAPAPPPQSYTSNDINIAVTPLNTPCRTDAQCGEGTVCINGQCRPQAEWEG